MDLRFDQSQIERYLKGKMIPVEVDAFELRLQSDNVLLAETKAYARINELSLPDRPIFQQAAEVTTMEKETAESNEAPNLTGALWGVAIGILIVLALWYYFRAM